MIQPLIVAVYCVQIMFSQFGGILLFMLIMPFTRINAI